MNASQLGREVKLSHVAIRNYLMGQLPKSEHLIKLARFFRVTTDWLLGLEEEGAGTTVTLREYPAEHLVDAVIAEAQEIRERAAQLEMMARKLKPSSRKSPREIVGDAVEESVGKKPAAK